MANWWESAPVVTPSAAPSAPPTPAAPNWYEAAPVVGATPQAKGPPVGSIDIKDGYDFIVGHPEIRAKSIDPNVDPQGYLAERQALRARADHPDLAGTLQKVAPVYNGMSFGWGDEASSALGAGIDALRGRDFGESYRRNQAIQKQGLDAEDSAHPWLTKGQEIAGGILPALAAAPAGALAKGGTWFPRVLAGIADAAGQGAVAGAGNADEGNRLSGALHGAGWGAALGTLGQAAAPVLSAGAKAVANAIASRSEPAIAGISSAARRYADRLFGDQATNAAMQQRLGDLGPHAMLADVSPEWQMIARGAASRPGSRDAIIEALTQRQGDANSRLGYDLDAALGRSVVPSQVEAGLGASRDAAAEGYGPVMAHAQAVQTQPLADALDAATVDLRGPAQQAVQRVRGYLNIPGTQALDPNPQALMATRQAIDGLITGETNPQVVRNLTMARQQVDGLLAQAAPGVKDVDAQMQELFRQSDALRQGRPILNNDATALRPQEVTDMVQQGAIPEGTLVGPSAVPLRLQQGVRAEIDRAAGTQANDVTALRKIVRGEGDWNRDKLGAMFGPDNADNALSAIDREAIFGDTANRVTRGSDTAPTQSFQEAITGLSKPAEIPPNLSTLGIIGYGAKKGFDALRAGAAARNAEAFAEDLGNTAVAQGGARDRLVQALIGRAQARVAPLNPNVQMIVDALSRTPQAATPQFLAGPRQ